MRVLILASKLEIDLLKSFSFETTCYLEFSSCSSQLFGYNILAPKSMKY